MIISEMKRERGSPLFSLLNWNLFEARRFDIAMNDSEIDRLRREQKRRTNRNRHDTDAVLLLSVSPRFFIYTFHVL